MKKLIVCGKGGSGKTTIVSLLIHSLAKRELGKNTKILLIDSDPTPTLSLSIDYEGGFPKKAVGELGVLLKEGDESQDKILFEDFKNNCVSTLNIEEKDIDFAYIGHHKENSCLCGYNHVLNYILKNIDESEYDYVIIDREAGVEHISRSVYGGKEDALVIVSWPTPDYLSVVSEIVDLADALGTTHNRLLVLNDIFGSLNDEDQANKIVNEIDEDLDYVIMPRLEINSGIKKKKANEVLGGEESKNLNDIIDKILEYIK